MGLVWPALAEILAWTREKLVVVFFMQALIQHISSHHITSPRLKEKLQVIINSRFGQGLETPRSQCGLVLLPSTFFRGRRRRMKDEEV